MVYFGFGHCIVFNALVRELQVEEKGKLETNDVRVAGSSTAGIECNVRLSNVRGWLQLELISALSIRYQPWLDIQVGDDDSDKTISRLFHRWLLACRHSPQRNLP